METIHTTPVQYAPDYTSDNVRRISRTNYLTNGRLVRDARGRVRFTYEGVRFEVGKNGYITTYERIGRSVELPPMEQTIPLNFLTNPALLRTLANAIELATE